MRKHFRKLVKITLVLIYLVIIAGATVRMTGSGMGCPDWPKCFGYYIPPTAEHQLLWQPDKAYKKGQVIIVDEALYVAKRDFKTALQYNMSNWAAYTKHDYAVFNAYHTWVEFINRLIGALAGLATLLMAFVSFRFWKEKKIVTILSWVAVFGMGFQGWLGATVVYSVLAPVKVTLHMVMALAIVALILHIVHLTGEKEVRFKSSTVFKRFLLLAFSFTVIQIVLGTQVRQFVDEQVKVLGDHAAGMWLRDAPVQFYIHRSFSIAVLALNGFLFLYGRKRRLGYFRMNYVMVLLMIEILTGIAMNYADFPFGSQAIHLILASIVFGIQYYLILEVKKALQFQRRL
ncbi:MAG: COX15/CtaA family protein [Bacteroidota bacterium]